MDKADFKSAVTRLRTEGFDMYPDRVRIHISDARAKLMAGLRFFLGEDAQWLSCYEQIAAWMTDNQGRGLLCVGNCGLGKTLICNNILPAIILSDCRKVMAAFSALDINDRTQEVMRNKLAVIDDIGTEPEAVRFGERHLAFSEIVDNAEKKSNLLVITTNLRTSHKIGQDGNLLPSIEDKYGIRTLDRLKAITKVVKFTGSSFRK